MGERRKQGPFAGFMVENRRIFAEGLCFLAILLIPIGGQAKLTSLGITPPWPHLEKYQETITAEKFRNLLDEVYAPKNAYRDWIRIELGSHARIRLGAEKGKGEFVLRFGSNTMGKEVAPRFWRRLREMPRTPKENPLLGLRIVLDPGHIGGAFGVMEHRSFSFPGGPPIQEGDLTLKVALDLKERLSALGASVWLTRSEAEPTTDETPESMMALAYKVLSEQAKSRGNDNAKLQPREIRDLGELLYYRVSEIRARAEKINHQIKPDLVLALHFNASTWTGLSGDKYPWENHFHVLVNGAYSEEELSHDDIRFEMLSKLLSGAAAEEIALGESLALSMAEANGLPPFFYTTPNAVKVGGNPYLWGRNLLANRIYQCPVVYLEPYVLNSREVAERVRAGDFEGYREVAGALRKSLLREYADGVINGLLNYYGHRLANHSDEPAPAILKN